MAAKGQGFGQSNKNITSPRITIMAPQKLGLRVQPANSQRKNDTIFFIAVPFINCTLHYSMISWCSQWSLFPVSQKSHSISTAVKLKPSAVLIKYDLPSTGSKLGLTPIDHLIQFFCLVLIQFYFAHDHLNTNAV
jgi:hypothetical protein